jgi:uncharacterized protein YacL
MTRIQEVTVLVYADRDGQVRARVTHGEQVIRLGGSDGAWVEGQAVGYVEDAFWLVRKAVQHGQR